MSKRGRPAKEKFQDLPEEFKNQVNSSNREEIRKLMSEIACNQIELMTAKKEDMHLQEMKVQYQDAGALYKEGSKANKEKLEFCKATLDAMGG